MSEYEATIDDLVAWTERLATKQLDESNLIRWTPTQRAHLKSISDELFEAALRLRRAAHKSRAAF